MKPLERIQAVLRREAVDRLPVDLWCTDEVLGSLKEHTGLEDELAVYDALGLDKIVAATPDLYYHGPLATVEGADRVLPWGHATRRVKAGLATYEETVHYPLADFTEVAQLEDYPWPDPAAFGYSEAAELATRAKSFGFAVLSPWVAMFELYCQMRGLEEALIDTVANEDFLERALDHLEEVQTAVIERTFAEFGDRVDLVFTADDLGTQTGQLMSLETWRTHLRPRLRRWCELAHRHGKKVLYHTDGTSSAFIPGLIECGVDVLNPVQHECPGMDMADLKDRYGDALVFHGGIDNQWALPLGTPDDVVKETQACLQSLGRDMQGYIVCSCHNAQAGTPVENILAMIATVKEFG
jgi:uroporphyrinogen decarboxylase